MAHAADALPSLANPAPAPSLTWQTAKVTDLKSGASIHLTANGDSALLYTDKGELIRARLTAEGYKEISRVALLEPTFPFAGRKVAWPPPADANRHIFVRFAAPGKGKATSGEAEVRAGARLRAYALDRPYPSVTLGPSQRLSRHQRGQIRQKGMRLRR
jgi:hypothetical protein